MSETARIKNTYGDYDSQFTVGTAVALFSSSGRMSKQTVGKVHKNGQFFLAAAGYEDTRFTPSYPGTKARESGKTSWERCASYEVWAEKHVEHMADQISEGFRKARVARIRARLATLELQRFSDGQLAALEALLPPAPDAT